MMQSHLSRRVFRAIINNEPLYFSRCRRNQLLHTIPPARVRPCLHSSSHLQRRTLFAFNVNPTASEGDPTTLPSEKGLPAMADLKRSLEDRSRAPPIHTLAKAFKLFFTTRVETPDVINQHQASLLSITWKHLKGLQSEMDDREWQDVFSIESLERMLFVISEADCLPEARNTLLRVARFAYLELCADHGFGINSISRQALLVYIELLVAYGASGEAKSTIMKFGGRLRGATRNPWLTVLKGFAIEGALRQLHGVTKELEQLGNKFDQATHQEMIEVLISKDLLVPVRTMYECPISGEGEPSLATKLAVIKFAILKSDIAWAKSIYESLGGLSSKTAGITLLWEAAHGSSVSSLAEIVKSWSTTNPRLKKAITITDLNSLLQYANSIQNPHLNAELAQLANEWNLVPNEQTHLLLLESFIQAGDVGKTLKMLEEHVDPNSLMGENLPLANNLIIMLCASEQKDALFQQISTLLDPLFHDNVHLEPRTIAALSNMLLYRHDFAAVSDLLRPRLGRYDDEGKALIRDALSGFILDLSQKDSEAWEVYELFRLAFPETGVAMRTEIMCAFFERKRSNLAVLVFGHMRQADDRRRRPKPDTYARCLQGLARSADATNLELVHNMLKIDVEVNLTTRILNGLMMAYAACDMPDKSMEIFREILQSKEGPSEKTIAIYFKLCENHHNGTQEAIKMLTKVKKLGIALDRRVYTAYIQALGAQCDFDLAVEAIDKMQAEIGVPPTSNTIALFYNSMPYQYWKDEVEQWAREKYPALWEHLSTKERSEHEEGQRFDGVVNEVWV
ncbi:uncharacterized protein N7459_005177 [Penicillium hispanicum]|uniref:uncharacterized protein n=1 Tax=Penicillium hispanicum TaxID=1080232 RepID=UPI0025411337|nr:uncharacterized protein N7459_005177 [Penicillium hispanicum]KAJ5585377.1 hypothetical protein N7459_005177 [Penicillium hispanicum]